MTETTPEFKVNHPCCYLCKHVTNYRWECGKHYLNLTRELRNNLYCNDFELDVEYIKSLTKKTPKP